MSDPTEKDARAPAGVQGGGSTPPQDDDEDEAEFAFILALLLED